MRKLSVTLSFILLMNVVYCKSYTAVLDKINDYLKTFDNGYYGHLEIDNGVLYDRYQSGKYSKINMSDISYVKEEEYKRKVALYCTGESLCVYSTYTDSYHSSVSFSTSTDFNTQALIDMFNELITSYKNKNGSGSRDAEARSRR